MTSRYYNPADYRSPDALVASGVTPPPLPSKLGFVTQSPGNLFLARKGHTSQTNALVTVVQSATEIVTQKNEVINVRPEELGVGVIATDIGASVDGTTRELLVTPSVVTPVEAPSVAPAAEPAPTYGEAPNIATGPTQSEVYAQQVNAQHAAFQASKPKPTIENASPQNPTYYYVPPTSYQAPAPYVAPTPAPTAGPYNPAGPSGGYVPPYEELWNVPPSYTYSDYDAYLLGAG